MKNFILFLLMSCVSLASIAQNATIIRGEYFIDTDPGFGNGIPITINNPGQINFSVVASGLSEGYHKLYGRLLDNQNNWSLTFRYNMEVYKSLNTNVVKAEYFFNTDLDFGNCTPVVFANPSTDGTFSFNIPVNQIPSGADTLFIRVQDGIENHWSITQVQDLSTTLPLTIVNFSAQKDNNHALLKWQTINEVNTAYFNLQRSRDGANFTNVGKVNAKNTAGLQNDYAFSDDVSALGAGKVYYRLQMMDNDGKFTYSKILYITIEDSRKLFTIYPNPAHNFFMIRNYTSINLKNASVLVSDLSGRKLISRNLIDVPEQKINIATLSKGIYVVNIATPGNVQTQKLLVE